MPVPSLIDREMCEIAWEMIGPVVRFMNERDEKGAGHVIVLNPAVPFEPKYHGRIDDPEFVGMFFDEVVIYDAPVGAPGKKFFDTALNKAYVSFVTGVESHRVQVDAPWAYEPGMTKWGGSAVKSLGNSRLIVAYSGHTEIVDRMISRMLAEAIEALTCTRMRGIMESEERLLPESILVG